MGNKPIYGNVGIVGFDECDNLLLYIPIFLRIFIRFIINVRHYLILLFKITSTKNKNMSLHFSLSLSLSISLSSRLLFTVGFMPHRITFLTQRKSRCLHGLNVLVFAS